MDYWYYGFITLGFLSVAGLLEGLYLTWSAYRGPEAKRVEQRLKAMSAGTANPSSALLKKRLLSEIPFMQSLLLRIPRIHLLDRLLVQSGSTLTVFDLLTLCTLLIVASCTLTYFLFLPLPIAMLLIIGTPFIPLLYIQNLRRQRLRKIEMQLPDALDLMARAMQAGHAFSSALSMVASEGPVPIAQEFHTAFDEISFGVSLQDALVNLATRVSSTDLRYFVIAVLVQRESGGNLAELLSSIATLIRERLKLEGTIKVLSAEGRMSAWVLSLLPFLVAGILQLTNPGFLSVLWTDPLGNKLASYALSMLLIGIFWLWRMIAIRI
jgi:tight adherence protein B